MRQHAAVIQQAGAKVRCHCGPPTGGTVAALEEAASALDACAQSLLGATQVSRSYVDRTIGGGGGSGGSSPSLNGSDESAADNDSPGTKLAKRHQMIRASERRRWDDAVAAQVETTEAFSHPTEWNSDINGEGPTPENGRGNNCLDCARAVEVRWRGGTSTAAPHSNPESPGQPSDFLEKFAGAELQPTTMLQIETELLQIGHGASALVTVSWKEGGGHAFNAVNDGGHILFVDGQTNKTSGWPPGYASQAESWSSIVMDQSGDPKGDANAY